MEASLVQCEVREWINCNASLALSLSFSLSISATVVHFEEENVFFFVARNSWRNIEAGLGRLWLASGSLKSLPSPLPQTLLLSPHSVGERRPWWGMDLTYRFLLFMRVDRFQRQQNTFKKIKVYLKAWNEQFIECNHLHKLPVVGEQRTSNISVMHHTQ